MRRTLATILALAASVAMAGEARYGLPWDWSHRAHIQKPELPGEAMARGEYDAWLRKTADPRYLAALVRKVDAMAAREGRAAGKALAKVGPNPELLGGGLPRDDTANRRNPGGSEDPNQELGRDWSNVMGGAAGVGINGAFPAKYAFDINAAPDCANDFVVYGTGSAGATGSGNFATRNGTVTGTNPGGGTVTITNGTRVLTLTRSATLNTGLNFLATNGNSAAQIAAKAVNLAAAINRNGGTVGVSATSSGATVTVTAITQSNAANSIALAEGINFFSWAGGTLQNGTGAAGQPTIIAFNQLYKTTCDDPVNNPDTRPLPNTFWSYSTGTGAVVQTSPVLSLDGSQVAFIETTAGVASLVILKWSSTVSVGTVGAPTAPALAGSAAAYRACAAPCMYKLSLGANNMKSITGFDGATTNTWGSSPYYDYEADSLYVGTATGVLHKFNGIFIGNPAAAGAPWPVTVATGLQLSSPVYDGATGLVFVGSERATGVSGAGGRLHSVNASGTVVTSGELAKGPYDNTGGTGVAEAPLIDSMAQRAYVFVASSTAETCAGQECAAVYQIPINASINGVTGTRATIGRGELKERILWMGAFSDAYWASTPASPTGHLFACGSSTENSSASSRRPTLYRIPITANVMGAAVEGPRLVNADATPDCSPITEVTDGTTDRLFVSVPGSGSATGCTGSCIYMFNVAGTWNTAKTASAGLTAPGGTGGIIIDNISTTTGASQIYYSTRTNPGNAIQASQAALN